MDRVSATKTVPDADQQQGQAEHDAARGRVDGVADVVEADRGRAGHAGDHRIGIAHRHHAGGEDVAVLVDQALAVAEQEAVALQAAIQEVGIVRVALRKSRIADLDPFGSGTPRLAIVAWIRSSRPTSTGVP